MDDLKMCVILVVTVVTLALLGWTTCSYFEAKAYNEITGKHVTTGQAMFLQLRVDNPSK